MEEGTPIQDQPSRPLRLARGVILLALAGVVLLAFSSISSRHPSAATSVLLEGFNLRTATPSTLKLGTTNKYSEKDGGSPGQFYPWLNGNLLAEPYRLTVFKVLDYDPSKEYEWELYSEETGNLEQIFTGYEFVHTFQQEDVWSDKFLVVNEFDTTDETENSRRISSTVSVKLYVRYVRREIRNLFDEERDEVLDTMALHWKVDQEEGEKLYGSNYVSMQTMLEYHLAAAGDQECDHFHDGYGFLQQHSALTILFEQSMQAVNPSLALPYWDYIFDFEKFETEYNGEYGTFNNGDLFNENYFGGTNDENHIMNGRWAGLAMPTVDDLSEEMAASLPSNAFGILRAPWSNNDDPLAVRGSETCGCSLSYGETYLPTCQGMGSLTSKASFLGWYNDASYGPHGPAHLFLGGLYGCSDAFDTLETLMEKNGIGTSLAGIWRITLSVYAKEMYRQDLLDCSSTDGGCKCSNYDEMVTGDIGDLKEFVDNIIDSDDVRGLDMADEVYLQFYELLCNTALTHGENLQSSSSWMPEFWPLHGNVERMYQLRRMKGPWEGGFNWGAHSWIYSDTDGTGVKNWQANCYGHGKDDLVLLGKNQIMVKGKKTDLSIQEYLSILEPANMVTLDYIYDNVEWTYCTEQSLTLP